MVLRVVLPFVFVVDGVSLIVSLLVVVALLVGRFPAVARRIVLAIVGLGIADAPRSVVAVSVGAVWGPTL